MTTVAWDGTTLAADKMMSDGDFKAVKTKIRAVPGVGLLGCSGCATHTGVAMEWLIQGRNGPYPHGKEKDDFVYMLHVNLDGKLDAYYDCEHPVRVESPFYAVGSGRDFALATMHLGFGAKEAVNVASHLDMHTGMGIDTVTLEDCK